MLHAGASSSRTSRSLPLCVATKQKHLPPRSLLVIYVFMRRPRAGHEPMSERILLMQHARPSRPSIRPANALRLRQPFRLIGRMIFGHGAPKTVFDTRIVITFITTLDEKHQTRHVSFGPHLKVPDLTRRGTLQRWQVNQFGLTMKKYTSFFELIGRLFRFLIVRWFSGYTVPDVRVKLLREELIQI
jgi:hypothetical protein